jgi:hypothetical protein
MTCNVTFVEDASEKEHALKVMINPLHDNPEEIIKKQLLPRSVQKVKNGKNRHRLHERGKKPKK